MNTEYFLYTILILFLPLIVFLCFMFCYIFIAPLICMWTFTFSLLGWKKPQELAKQWFPELYVSRFSKIEKAQEK